MDPGLSDVSVRSERSGSAVLQVEGDVQQQVPQQDRAGFLSALPNKEEVVRQVRFVYSQSLRVLYTTKCIDAVAEPSWPGHSC